MGEVYRETDTRLGREVALKLLPEAFVSDPERLARFEREARLLASLNHPNVAQLFEAATLEDGNTARLIAMELCEGEDLAARLQGGVRSARRGDRHRKADRRGPGGGSREGIVHRDLKPANVKLTPDGEVKVLDFGLAKAWTGDGPGAASSAELSHSPTLAHTGTAAGLILGDGRPHLARAGARPGGRPTGRRVGLRGRAVRDADRGPGLPGRQHRRHDGLGAEARARTRAPAGVARVRRHDPT
jgi:serine/threonine protein kinase